MSIYRPKGSPYYQFDFQIQCVRFSGSTKCANEREARAVEKARRAEARRMLDDGLAASRRPLTLGEACDRWWNEVGARGNDPDLRRALIWLSAQIGETMPLHAIDDDDLSRAVEARRSALKPAGRDDKGARLFAPLSNRTVNKTVTSLLSRVMRRARRNWSAFLPSPPDFAAHLLPERKRGVREITAAEDARIDAVESIDYAELREFAELMGLRRRELLLTWPQVDFAAATIAIIGKGGKPAVLPLPQRAYEILWRRRGHHDWHVWTFVAQRTRRCPKTRQRFVKGQRYPMTYHGIGTNRRRAWAKAGVNARLHDTRHTTGMRTLRATGNLKLVQKLLRHSRITTTAKFYTDATLDDLRAGLELTARATNRMHNRDSESRKNSRIANARRTKIRRRND